MATTTKAATSAILHFTQWLEALRPTLPNDNLFMIVARCSFDLVLLLITEVITFYSFSFFAKNSCYGPNSVPSTCMWNQSKQCRIKSSFFCSWDGLQSDPVGYLMKSLVQNDIERESLALHDKKSLECCLSPDMPWFGDRHISQSFMHRTLLQYEYFTLHL